MAGSFNFHDLVEEKTEKYCFGGVDSGKGDKYASVQV
jgi:hypothetical protein